MVIAARQNGRKRVGGHGFAGQDAEHHPGVVRGRGLKSARLDVPRGFPPRRNFWREPYRPVGSRRTAVSIASSQPIPAVPRLARMTVVCYRQSPNYIPDSANKMAIDPAAVEVPHRPSGDLPQPRRRASAEVAKNHCLPGRLRWFRVLPGRRHPYQLPSRAVLALGASVADAAGVDRRSIAPEANVGDVCQLVREPANRNRRLVVSGLVPQHRVRTNVNVFQQAGGR